MAKAKRPQGGDAGESFAAVAEHAPALLWRGDAEGRCVYLNKAQREFWGVEAGKIDAFKWTDTLLEEDAPLVFGPFAAGMAAHEPFACQARYRRADGAIRTLQTRAEPYFDSAGAFTGMVGVNTDITDQLAAQAELAESEARLRALADNLPYGMVFQITAGPNGENRRFTFVSNQCAELNGVSAERAMKDPAALYNRILPDYRDAFAAAERAAVEAGANFMFEAPMGDADGQVRWFRIASAPRAASNGETMWDGVQIDITDVKAAEERRRLMMNEMSHRFKNMLSTILSIAAQTGRSAKSMAAFNKAFEARLQALAKSHALLHRDETDSADLRELLELELRPYADESRRTLTLTGAPVRLDGPNVIGLSLVVHELATNAAKYGAYARDGALEVAWAVERDGDNEVVRMVWTERGGPPPQANGAGFGTRLIQAVLKGDLRGDADMRFAPEGLRAELKFSPRR